MDKSEDKKPRVLDLGEDDITAKPERGHDEIVKMYNDYRATVIGDKEPTEQQMSILQGIADRLLEDGRADWQSKQKYKETPPLSGSGIHLEDNKQRK